MQALTQRGCVLANVEQLPSKIVNGLTFLVRTRRCVLLVKNPMWGESYAVDDNLYCPEGGMWDDLSFRSRIEIWKRAQRTISVVGTNPQTVEDKRVGSNPQTVEEERVEGCESQRSRLGAVSRFLENQPTCEELSFRLRLQR